jgi:ABC-type polar amino acid transport system ATPase subunit
MDQGQIVEIAAAKPFFEAPRSPRLRAFLAQILH